MEDFKNRFDDELDEGLQKQIAGDGFEDDEEMLIEDDYSEGDDN